MPCLRASTNVAKRSFEQGQAPDPAVRPDWQTREEDKSLDLHINYGELSPEEKEYMADKVKFAQEHPVEAERIHLKFKVCSLCSNSVGA